MKRYYWLIAFVLLCSTQVLSAQECCPDFSCESECGCGIKGSVYGDYLYWRIRRTELDFSPNGTAHYLKPKYDSGFRVGGTLACRCVDFGVRYTSYSSRTSRKNPEISEEEHLSYKLDYETVDLELGFSVDVNCMCGKIRPFAGVKFADIDEKFDFLEFNNEINKLDFCGTGLYLGAEGRFNVYTWQSCDCCWNLPVYLSLRGSTSIIDGKFDYTNIGSNSGNGKKDECIYTTCHELFLGAEFELNGYTSCVTPVLRIGYEAQLWNPWRESDSDDDIATLGLGGMVLGLEVGF